MQESLLMETVTAPLVSVGITTYNRPHYLRQALDCVFGQTYGNLEIIISEDCTPCEETKSLLRDYAHRDSRVRYFSQPRNVGPPANFQFVLKQARGEYFFWADDDDLRDARWVEVLLKKLKSQDAVVAFSDLMSIDLDGKHLRHFSPLRFAGARPVRLARYFLAEGAEGKVNLLCGLFRTEFLRGIKHWGQYDRSLLAVDLLFVLDILQHGNSVVDSSVTLYKRMGVGKSLPVNSIGEFFSRARKELRQDLASVRVVDLWLDKTVLLLLIPVKLFRNLLYWLARRTQ
jgi:glycosyltransferase involved in cell wall biosynthesis